jgi:hypothetical protein
MYKSFMGLLLFCIPVIFPLPMAANECENLVVTSIDGYANIRSTPRVKSANIIGTWYSGGKIKFLRKYSRWWQINAPITGWISANQVGKTSCQNARHILDTIGHPKIKALAKESTAGNTKSAQVFLSMSRGMDGETLEVYANSITSWVEYNPRFFISVLSTRSNPIRQSVIRILDFALGSEESTKRRAFETALGKFPKSNIVATEWRSRRRNL